MNTDNDINELQRPTTTTVRGVILTRELRINELQRPTTTTVRAVISTR